MRDDTGHRTATIPRPRPAATAGTRRPAPVVARPPVDPARRRRSRIVLGLLATVVAGAVGASVLILPIKAWRNQRQEISKRQTELAGLDQQNTKLQADVDRLRTDAGVVEAAREELGAVRQGERVYKVVAAPALPNELPEGWLYPTIAQLMTARSAAPAAAAAPVASDPVTSDPVTSDPGATTTP